MCSSDLKNGIIIKKNIESEITEKAIIKPFNFTFNPKAWDLNSLYIETNNGGSSTERYFLKGQNISHSNFYSSLISSCHGYGNTEGVFIVADKNKSISFENNMSISALTPSIDFKEIEKTFFFRLQYSATELDETRKPESNFSHEFQIAITCN